MLCLVRCNLSMVEWWSSNGCESVHLGDGTRGQLGATIHEEQTIWRFRSFFWLVCVLPRHRPWQQFLAHANTTNSRSTIITYRSFDSRHFAIWKLLLPFFMFWNVAQCTRRRISSRVLSQMNIFCNCRHSPSTSLLGAQPFSSWVTIQFACCQLNGMRARKRQQNLSRKLKTRELKVSSWI